MKGLKKAMVSQPRSSQTPTAGTHRPVHPACISFTRHISSITPCHIYPITSLILQNLSRTKSGDAKSKSPNPPSNKVQIAGTTGSSPSPSSPLQHSPAAPRPGQPAASSDSSGLPTTPRRSPVSDKTSPAPPLVVISGAPNAPNSEMPPDPIPHSPHSRGSPDRSLGPDGQPTPPRAGPLNRLRGPKDTIPIVGKTPRKQRSSRFYVTEKVEIEQLPNFLGAY